MFVVDYLYKINIAIDIACILPRSFITKMCIHPTDRQNDNLCYIPVTILLS